MIARTTHGAVEGERNEGVVRFRGIPFAARIDGPWRFQSPRPPRAWSGVRPALTWAPQTPQIADVAVVKHPEYHRFLFGRFYDLPMSEDGLFLNLWTPSLDKGAKRPVMVWLHGGGFTTGVPTRPREEASLLSARGDVVVVAPSHRLGAFGYLYLDELTGGAYRTANLGILDIIAALQWVAENAEAFGGDPQNVTVFGESGGAMKTATLLATPGAKGLMHRGICQAGVFAKGFRFCPQSAAAATEASRALLRRLGIDRDFDRLADLPMETIIAAQETADWEPMAWRPVIDGEILPMNPAEALVEGTELNVPMIVGWAAHEVDFICRDLGRTHKDLETTLGPKARTLLAGYAAAHPGATTSDLVEAAFTDWAFGMPSIQFAEARAKSGHSTYVYQFAWRRSKEPTARATHGAETPFVFARLDATGYSRDDPSADSLSAIVQEAWASFSHAGDPNAPGLPAWPRYEDPEREVMTFDVASGVTRDPKASERAVWNKLLIDR